MIAEEDISALRLITLMDIYAVLSLQWEPIIPEIQSLIETQVCINRVFFTVIPEAPHLYPDPIEATLSISIMLLKFKLEAISIKKFEYTYDDYRHFHSTSHKPYTAVKGHVMNITEGIRRKLRGEMDARYQKLPLLSSLVPTLNSKINIDTINYVCK